MDAISGLIDGDIARKIVQAHRGLISENQLAHYRPFGHPDTLCPDGILWREKHEREGWIEWSNKPWQIEFHKAGATNPERMLICASGVGKTYAGAPEVAIHLTGLYPDWWEGRRFEKPITAWVGSLTNSAQRVATQPTLLGVDLGENLGTGFIPKSRLVGRVAVRAADAPDVVDSVGVRHISGGVSRLKFLTYEMGWRKWQGGKPELIWLDEEPDENDSRQKYIYVEVQTRIFRSRGIAFVTYTPLLGETVLTRHFMYPKAKGIWHLGSTWDDVPHLAEEEKERLRKSYPDHQVEARTKGVPMMGEGRVFSVSEESIACQPFQIPDHFARICGMDFGINEDHPTAMAWLTWDRDTDILYVYNTYRRAGETAAYHAEAWRRGGNWIPVAWPHDGLKKDPGSGKVLRDVYLEHGVNMLSHSACYDDKVQGAQPQEPIILDILERMKTGRFKVFNTCIEWFEEFRSYHRKDGKLVAHHEDVLKASFYATMMLRWASPHLRPHRRISAGRMASTRL